jgi:hypothetical protein
LRHIASLLAIMLSLGHTTHFFWLTMALPTIAHNFKQLPLVLVRPKRRTCTTATATTPLILVDIATTVSERRAEWQMERLFFDLSQLLVDVLHLPTLLLSGHLSRGKAERFRGRVFGSLL